jgi:ABC-type lipopolysaccharide export system ATPase subunit
MFLSLRLSARYGGVSQQSADPRSVHDFTEHDMSDTDLVIRVQHVVKKFGEVTAVDDISFDVRRGEIFAFLGPNGAGKPTIDPLTCGVDGLRGAFIGVTHFTMATDAAVLGVVGMLFLSVGAWRFTKLEV